MNSKPVCRKCRHCRKFFFPDYRHSLTQLYCSAPDCRRACKAVQQRRWLRKGKNRDYFRGADHVERVRKWRQSHVGYWKKKTPISQEAQTPPTQTVNPKHESCNVPAVTARTLQDFCLVQDPDFIGLLSMITGSTLQEEIEVTARRVLLQGHNILGLVPPGSSQAKTRLNAYDPQTNPPARPVAADPHQF
jgi:hypothetical protein